MMSFLADLAVMAAGSVLLVGGSSKVVWPRPIASTLAMLWNTVTGQAREAAPFLGRLLGIGEIGLAAATVVHRSHATAAALALFAVGVSVAGMIGVLSVRRLPCACFGRSDRSLGYPHILQFPLWSAVAWGVAREASLFGEGTRPEQGLAMLAVCAIVSTAFQAARLWRAVYPIARQRRRRTAEATGFPIAGAGSSSW